MVLPDSFVISALILGATFVINPLLANLVIFAPECAATAIWPDAVSSLQDEAIFAHTAFLRSQGQTVFFCQWLSTCHWTLADVGVVLHVSRTLQSALGDISPPVEPMLSFFHASIRILLDGITEQLLGVFTTVDTQVKYTVTECHSGVEYSMTMFKWPLGFCDHSTVVSDSLSQRKSLASTSCYSRRLLRSQTFPALFPRHLPAVAKLALRFGQTAILHFQVISPVTVSVTADSFQSTETFLWY